MPPPGGLRPTSIGGGVAYRSEETSPPCRKGGTATLDTLLAIWIKFIALLVGWEPLLAFSHTLQLFH